MKRTLLLLASIALAKLLASVVAVIAPKELAWASFPSIKRKIVFVRDGARDSHIFMIKALKDWKRGATASLLDAPRITLEAEASPQLVLICWTYSRSARREPA